MKLDKQLTAVLEEIDASRVIDVGCDHGKLGVALLECGRAKECVFLDISTDSLEKARTLSTKYGYQDRSTFIVADGADYNWQDDDLIVVAGMGGNEIVKVLTSKSVPVGSVFVPHQDANVLREFFNSRDITVSKDYVVKSKDKYYDILVVGKGEKFSDNEIFVGKNAPFSEYYESRIEERLKKISKYISGNVSENLMKEKECLENAKAGRDN